MSVKIIFENDGLIQNSEARKQFVSSQKGGHCSLLIDDEQYIVLKKGKEGKATLEDVRAAAGNIARDLGSQKIESAELDSALLGEAFASVDTSKAAEAFAEGWDLGGYQFSKYKSENEQGTTELNIKGEDAAVQSGKIRAAAMAFSRDLMNELSSELNPETYPEVLKEKFAGTAADVKVYYKEQLEEMKMNGVLTVCRGSKYSPSFVEISYQGDTSKPLVALVGKGVTFDTGGISLKSGRDLSDMRMDMGGSAAVAGAMQLLVESKAAVNVVALIPIVENAPDNTAVYPGEVIEYKNGKTVQVGNTDAEGRLILADGLIRAGELDAEYIVDIATLTGAIVNALGTGIGGVFGDEELSRVMKEIGEQNGDFVWPMPLIDAYDKSLASDYADMNNISTLGFAGSITAGLFLRRFVPENSKWLHVDMAGMMDKSAAAGYYAKSATGYGARLLADYTVKISE